MTKLTEFGDQLFQHAREVGFAIPAINVTSSSTAIAALEAARDSRSPIILQASHGGAAYWAGKGVSNKEHEASIAGAIAAAHFIRAIAPTYKIPVILHTDHCARKLLPWLDGMLDADEAFFKEHGIPLFSSHMIDLSEESVEYNIQTTAKYLARAAPWKQWLEMEIGITGGEEDGVDNENVDKNSLYTQPEDIWNVYQTLSPVSPYFSIAAGFGNVHGVYQPYVFPFSHYQVKKQPRLTKAVVMSNFVLSCFPSIKILSRASWASPLESPSSSSFTVDRAPVWRISKRQSDMVSSKSTLTPVRRFLSP